MSVLILAYHRISNDPADGLSVTPAMFAQQLDFLSETGWAPLSLEEVIPCLAKGKDERHFAVTFDDGYQDNYTNAFPILSEKKVPATVFVTTAYLGDRKIFPWMRSRFEDGSEERLPLTWSQVEEMSRSGLLDIGAHTHTHPHLSALDEPRGYEEVSKCKHILEDRLGKAIPTFCYPYGDLSNEVTRLVETAGYSLAVVTPPRYIRQTAFTLLRQGVYSHTSMLQFKMKVSLPHRWLMQSVLGWHLRSSIRRLVRSSKKIGIS